MEDMVDLKPFQAANKTSLFVLEKGRTTSYPVPVVIWQRLPGTGAISPDWKLPEVLSHTDRNKVKAIPVNPSRLNSSWQTAVASSLKGSEKMRGETLTKLISGRGSNPMVFFGYASRMSVLMTFL